jgi:octaprenyl-diphosphate synthase
MTTVQRQADSQRQPPAGGNRVLSPGLARLYAPILHDLDESDAIFRREMRSKYPYVDELVRYGCLLGGKRLRPALLLLSARATGPVTHQHLVLAAVVEMIHTATLVHDDVLDEADVRRHLATVNARWDDEASILLGDFLFSHAFYLASTLGSTAACRIIGRSTNIVCEGEIRQKGSRGDYEISEEDYLAILEAKTGELCACCCDLGGRLAGATRSTVQQLATFGRQLGIAFQIADDLLDLDGDEDTVGKSLGTDLNKQKPTLPIIRALAVADSVDRQEILDIAQQATPEHASRLRPYLSKYDAVSYARQKARCYANRARLQLDGFANSPAAESLRLLTEFVVQRAH